MVKNLFIHENHFSDLLKKLQGFIEGADLTEADSIIVREYYQLALKSELSTKELDRIIEIDEISIGNDQLFRRLQWIDQMKTNVLNSDNLLSQDQNFAAYLEEYLIPSVSLAFNDAMRRNKGYSKARLKAELERILSLVKPPLIGPNQASFQGTRKKKKACTFIQ